MDFDEISHSSQKELHEAFKRKEAETGKSVAELLVGFCNDARVSVRDRLEAMRIALSVLCPGCGGDELGDEFDDDEDDNDDGSNVLLFPKH